ncbi:hypothetical protein F511_15117 [Dorcoceras hygrometricum]|uniref:Uncharacterized protein n=1 Tax=Dorcoceras hygrometricum TaxID=472368 RepID=A0A2Z7BLY7_9LAMI|nr:hypothetical protein F511_15117 [Dorcoceras hygrometricum]
MCGGAVAGFQRHLHRFSIMKIQQVRYNYGNSYDQIRETMALIPLLGIRIRPPRSETPSSGCTRSPDEISTNEYSSKNWAGTFSGEVGCGGGRRTAAARKKIGGGVCLGFWDESCITDSACKNQSVVVSVQYGPFNPYIPIRSTTIGKSRVARDPIAMHTSWRSNSDIASVTRDTASRGPTTIVLRNHNFGLAQRIMVKRLATSRHDPLGITDSACKKHLVVVSVQYGPFKTYIPIRSTTIDSIGYPRMRASGEFSTTKHRLLHASGLHPIPPHNDPKLAKAATSQGSVHSNHTFTCLSQVINTSSDILPDISVHHTAESRTHSLLRSANSSEAVAHGETTREVQSVMISKKSSSVKLKQLPVETSKPGQLLHDLQFSLAQAHDASLRFPQSDLVSTANWYKNVELEERFPIKIECPPAQGKRSALTKPDCQQQLSSGLKSMNSSRLSCASPSAYAKANFTNQHSTTPIRDAVIEAIVSFFNSFRIRRLSSLVSVSDLAAKEVKMLKWAETYSLQTAVQRLLYITDKYRDMLLRKFLEARCSNFESGTPTSAIDLHVLDLLSEAHRLVLDVRAFLGISCIAPAFYSLLLFLLYCCSPYWGLTPCPSGAWLFLVALFSGNPGSTAGRGFNPAGGAPGGG